MAERVEEFQFQAETKQLLDLMIHSLYTNKEIFLRELISNASDACDKLRYNAIADPDLLAGDTRLAIRIEADKTAGTLTVADNGIGMDRQELMSIMARALATLAQDRRRAVELHLQGLTVPEISDLLAWSEARTRNLVYRGLDDLRQALRREGIDSE